MESVSMEGAEGSSFAGQVEICETKNPKYREAKDLCVEEDSGQGGAELSVASNADLDSTEGEEFESCTGEAGRGWSSKGRPRRMQATSLRVDENLNDEVISRTSSWEDCGYSPSDIVKLIIKEAESSEMVWTNDQHCSYLNSIEAAFVRNMFGKAYHASERVAEGMQCDEISTSEDFKSRPQLQSSSSSGYSQFTLESRWNNKKKILNSARSSQKRQLIIPLVLDLESRPSQHASSKYEDFRKCVSEQAQPDNDQGKQKYQKHCSEHFSKVEKAQHDVAQNENLGSDQVVPTVAENSSRCINDLSSAVAGIKSNLECIVAAVPPRDRG